jgi:hypothetical protein
VPDDEGKIRQRHDREDSSHASHTLFC